MNSLRHFRGLLFSALILTFFLLGAPISAQQAMEIGAKALQAREDGRLLECAELWKEAARQFAEEAQTESEARALFYAAGALFDAGEKEAALEPLRLARERFAGIRSFKGMALVSLQQGIVQRDLGNWAQAEKSLRESIDTARQGKDEARALEALELLSGVLEAGRRWTEATVVIRELIDARREQEPSKVPDLLITLGALYQLQDQGKNAERTYLEAIALLEEQERKAEALETRERLARHLGLSGEEDKALEQLLLLEAAYKGQDKALQVSVDRSYFLLKLKRYEESLALVESLLQKINDSKVLSVLKARKLEALLNLGKESEAEEWLDSQYFDSDFQRAEIANSLGRRELAEDYYRRALDEAQASDKALYANALAIKLMHWDRPEEASILLQQALAELPEEDSKVRATLTLNLGESFLKRGLAAQAVPHFEWSARQFEQMKSLISAATAYNNLSAAYEQQGEYAKAIVALDEASRLGDKFQEPNPIQATINNARGLLLVKLGQVEEGINYYRRARFLHQRFSNVEGQISVLINLGAATSLIDRPDQARDFYTEALKLAGAQGRRTLQATIYNNLGLLETDGEKARVYLLKALESHPNSELFEAIVQSNLAANDFNLLGQKERGLKSALQAAETLQNLGARENEIQSRELLLQHAREVKDWESIRESTDRIVLLTEELVTGLSGRTARSFVKSREKSLRPAFEFALEQDPKRAFSWEEKLRSFGLAALTNQFELRSAHLPEELVQRQQGLLESLRREQSLPPKKQDKVTLRDLNQQYRQAFDEAERYHLAAGALQPQRAIDVEDVQRNLGSTEALLEYIDDGQKLHLILIRPQKIVQRSLGPKNEIDRSVRLVLSKYKVPGILDEAIIASEELVDLIWHPIQEHLDGVESLVVVPTGSLFSVPFPALFSSGEPLSENFKISTASSASAWLVSRQSPSNGRGALIGALGNFVLAPSKNSSESEALRNVLSVPLPATLDELKALIVFLPDALQLKEKEMTKSALRSMSEGKRTLHYATHGILEREEPLQSGLLASDGLLSVDEIFGWKLDAELAVLSACHSGQRSDGEDYLSLTSAFQYAGARTLLVSLWAVSDRATAEWMAIYYEKLRQGRSLDEALSETQRSLRDIYPHPHYWAAFTLWGDGNIKI